MVITSSIKRAIEYYKAVSKLLEERKSPFKAIVAFSGSVEYEGKHVTEADLNGFPSAKIEKTFKGDPYRILIVANKFQTGFDEPLLHTMYVDKGLADIKAVQTLSRLNRSHPDKKDTFILDFVNEPGVIKEAFDRYYKTTILSGETDVNMLNYHKTRYVIDEMKACKNEKARQKYRDEHDSDFIILNTAKCYFDSKGLKKLPSHKALQTEVEQLIKEKNELYNQYQTAKEEAQRLGTIRHNLEQTLGRKIEHKKEQER